MESQILLPTSIRRLLYDLKELKTSPVSLNINAAPLETNIYEWHGNLWYHNFTVSVFHFVLRFPTSYPKRPPSLLLSTRLPHANVLQTVFGWKVCLDMLDENSTMSEYKGWSQSYTVRSILMQLEAFLVDEAVSQNVLVGTWDQATAEAHAFHCDTCGSMSAGQVWPAWVTEAEIAQKSVREFRRPNIITKSSTSRKPVVGKATRPSQNTDDWSTVCRKAQKKALAVAPVTKPVIKPIQAAAPVLKSRKAVPVPKLVSQLQALPLVSSELAKPALASTPKSIGRDFSKVDISKAGLFAKMPYEMVQQILLSGDMTAGDVVSLSRTCHHMHSMCMDGYFWKSFFKRQYPHSEIKASSLDDWMAAFAQESNFAAWELKCYATKLTIEEDVLGLPIDFTMNPKTHKIDYISVVDSSDFLSRTAYREGLRRTVWNQEFRTWCPMYLSEEHFQRALPDLKEFMVRMCPQWDTSFKPTMVLEVIPKMMNTLVVLLMDNGVSASVKAIEGYFLLHRLLVAFLTEYPSLQQIINDRFRRFIGSEDCRTKQSEPSLGDLIPLLAVSEKWSWMTPGLSSAFLGEFFDRQVIWTCKEYPDLAKVPRVAPAIPKADEKILGQWYKAGKVSRRLVVFHVRLLHLLRKKGSIDDLRISSDMLYGRPPRHVVEGFQKTVKKIMTDLPNWPDFFIATFIATPTKAALTASLQQSVRNSLRKRYHRAGMDFTKIHSSGVSRILLKGQSYSAPPDLRNVRMKESWRWTSDGVLYLDASCSVYDFNNTHMEDIAWNHRHAFHDAHLKKYAVQHSGDVIQNEVKHGQHTIDLDMTLLSRHKSIKALVFCMSGYAGATMRDFRDPEVGLTSPDHGDVNLCEYKFEPTARSGSKTSVVMCILWRKDAKVSAKWEVKAIGELGDSAIGSSGHESLMSSVVRTMKDDYQGTITIR